MDRERFRTNSKYYRRATFLHKNAIIKWYKENPSYYYLALKFHETFIPKSKIIKYGYIGFLERNMEWLVEGLKRSGFI